MADTIKEFLVALGFKVDEEQHRRFDAWIARSTETIENLGRVMGVVVGAVAVGVDEMSQRLEDFYYVAQRSNTTVNSLQAMRYGFQQVGLSAEQASTSAEGLARSMRNNPGIRSLVEMLTGRTTRGRDTALVFKDLVDSLANMPTYQATQFERMLGLDPDVMYQYILNRERANAADKEAAERLKQVGLNVDEISRKAVELSNAYKKGQNEILIMGELAFSHLAGLAKYTVDTVDSLLAKINNADKATGGAASVGATAVAGVGIWGALAAVARVFGFKGLGPIAAAGRIVGSAGGVAGTVAGVATSPFAAFLYTLFGNPGEAGKSEMEYMKAHPELYGNAPALAPTAASSSMMQFFMSRGWSRAQAAGIVARLQMESELNPGEVGDAGTSFGIAQWHDPNRQAAFRARYGHDIQHSSLAEQLDFVDYELRNNAALGGNALKQTLDPGSAYEAFTRGFERPKDPNSAIGQAQAARLFSGAAPDVKIQQSNTYNITGTGDPRSTAAAVGDVQKRTNGDLLRDLRGSIR